MRSAIGSSSEDSQAAAASAIAAVAAVLTTGRTILDRAYQLPDFNVYCRGVHPSAIWEVTLVGVNEPVRIGGATVLPGDVVLGTREGVTFIPPHLAEEVVTRSEDVRQRDVFGKQCLAEGRYLAGQIDVSVWADEIEADYVKWSEERGLAADPRT